MRSGIFKTRHFVVSLVKKSAESYNNMRRGIKVDVIFTTCCLSIFVAKMHLFLHTGIWFCNVCEVHLGSKANYALHVLTREHCENLIRVGKCNSEAKSTISKKTSSDVNESKATSVIVDHINSTSSPAHGSFVASELCTNEPSKESDSVKYDCYWQSLAENLSNGNTVLSPEAINTNPTTVPPSCKTITKSLISCEVCDVVLTKIIDYESHIKTPEHIWNMRLCGMSAEGHRLKGRADSNAMNTLEVSPNSHQVQSNDLGQLTPTCESLELIPFPLLYCDACEMLLSTPRQFINHVNAGSHKSCVQKKGKMKVKKVKIPVPNKDYCYSCQLVLNSSKQFDEHKTGRKHKIRCTQLITRGIMIPPREQLPEWSLSEISPDEPVHYPEFYKQFALRKEGEELENSSNYQESLMNENSCESYDCVKAVDATSPSNISDRVSDLDAFPCHIYRIQNKNLDTYSELPFTLLANNCY